MVTLAMKRKRRGVGYGGCEIRLGLGGAVLMWPGREKQRLGEVREPAVCVSGAVGSMPCNGPEAGVCLPCEVVGGAEQSGQRRAGAHVAQSGEPFRPP